MRYDNQCTIGSSCSVLLSITEDVTGPVYVYYQMDNFYQNHRRYVKSRDYNQLKGQILSVADLSSCDPIVTIDDLGIYTTLDGNAIDGSQPANPCGLVAKSVFNDTYQFYNGTNRVAINENNIAWESDVEYKFKNND